MTTAVLAVIAEQLLHRTNADELVLSDEFLLDAPDLIAWRDEATFTTHIKVKR